MDEDLEKRMDLVRSIVNLGRGIREKSKIKVRQPLSELLVDGQYETSIAYMADLIKEELNVKNVVFEKNMDTYLNYSLKPDFRAAGPALGKNVKAFGAAIAKISPKDVMTSFERDGKIVLSLNGEDVDITKDLVMISVSAKEGFAAGLEGNLCVILDTGVTPQLEMEGLARELISKVQQMRKQKDFEMMDRIDVYVDADEVVLAAIDAYRDFICDEVLADSISAKSGLEFFDLNGHKTGIDVEKK